jgi:hypothetical protein
MVCWSSRKDGKVYTSAADQSNGWQVPMTRSVGNDGEWEIVHDSIAPAFDRHQHWNGDFDDDSGSITDLVDGSNGSRNLMTQPAL